MFIVDRKQQIPTLPAAKAVSSGQATMIPLYASRTMSPVAGLAMMFDPGLFANPTALTLTMKKRAGGRNADHIIASTNFRHFINRLSHALLGARAKRYGKTRQEETRRLENSNLHHGGRDFRYEITRSAAKGM